MIYGTFDGMFVPGNGQVDSSCQTKQKYTAEPVSSQSSPGPNTTDGFAVAHQHRPRSMAHEPHGPGMAHDQQGPMAPYHAYTEHPPQQLPRPYQLDAAPGSGASELGRRRIFAARPALDAVLAPRPDHGRLLPAASPTSSSSAVNTSSSDSDRELSIGEIYEQHWSYAAPQHGSVDSEGQIGVAKLRGEEGQIGVDKLRASSNRSEGELAAADLVRVLAENQFLARTDSLGQIGWQDASSSFDKLFGADSETELSAITRKTLRSAREHRAGQVWCPDGRSQMCWRSMHVCTRALAIIVWTCCMLVNSVIVV